MREASSSAMISWLSSSLDAAGQVSSLFFFFFFFATSCTCGILVPQPGMEPAPLHWKHGFLTTGLLGKSLLPS